MRMEVKNDHMVPDSSGHPIPKSTWVAKLLGDRLDSLSFRDFFQEDTILVPVPRSSLSLPNQLWVPERLASAMVKRGIGHDVVTALFRDTPIRSASMSRGNQPTALEGFQSLGVHNTITDARRIVLVDDFVTRGATALGAANRLLTQYPDAQITLFAAVRTQSNRFDFEHDKGPVDGTITLLPGGNTQRRP